MSQFPHPDQFVRRHIGPSMAETKAMLEALHVNSLDELINQTEEVIRSGSCSGLRMAELVGSWTWAALARRPALSTFSAVYRFSAAAGPVVFTLWASAVRELRVMCGLAPLLRATLSAAPLNHVMCCDASGTGMGVVAAAVPPLRQRPLLASIRPLQEQAQKGEREVDQLAKEATEALVTAVATRGNDRERRRAASARWDVVYAYRWGFREHINILEARALSCAVRYRCQRTE